ncbi:MAG TPA: hypothetical protein VLB80_03110 [Candidatus Babeliales bacterium]|nr:hypothetical protein [Candidatus Babeliales bacterium]
MLKNGKTYNKYVIFILCYHVQNHNNIVNGGGWQDPEDDKKANKKKYPNGVYKDAEYHNINSNGLKSKSPKNGQELLDNAFSIEGSQDSFIAIDGKEFVVFYKTMTHEFHGHIRTWKQLTHFMKNTLIHQGLVRRSGKIIRSALKK